MSYLQTNILTHKQRVTRLYKAALRCIGDHIVHRPSLRFNSVVLRERFEENSDNKDMIQVKKIIEDGEEELFQKQHYYPKKFPFSPGGVVFERTGYIPDWVLDYWHPLEKAQYPKYFAQREKRKLEYVEMWDKKYNTPSSDKQKN